MMAAGSVLSFLGALVVYWLTADSAVSFWDCPEYVLVAFRLENGHAPGNPTWALVSNVIAQAANAISGPETVAYALNLSSGLWTALAVMLLFQIIFVSLKFLTPNSSLLTFLASLAASLLFAWTDSPWFSAVETEVYALSLLFTALCLRVMLWWAHVYDEDRAKADRILILQAYILGLSIGVHELNLLAIPALALIFTFRRHPGRCLWRAWLSLLVSVVIIAVILFGIYPGLPALAEITEIWAVNSLHLPFNSGIIIFLAALLILMIAVPITVSAIANRRADAPWSVPPPGKTTLSTLHSPHSTICWMLSFLMLGYSSYLIVPIRGHQMPNINENAPTDASSFLSYLKRDQYGKKPLFYGHTPYSKPIYQETIDSAGKAHYKTAVKKKGRPVWVRAYPDARLGDRSGFLTAADSAANDAGIRRITEESSTSDAYLLAGYRYDYVTTPELDMFLPRLTSGQPIDIANYRNWSGMEKETMDEVEVSFALDSLGRPVGRMGADGKRTKEKSWRPTIWQNLRELLGYQIGYMYFRYLLWNFAGRQNDLPSAGEIEHGNFITGVPPIDNLMLGSQEELPAEIGRDNPGRNPYYMIPLAIGILGAVWLLRRGRRGKRLDAVVLTLFLMTGVAIVVYLNQDPGEPRERDYSFLGSFFAFAIWIGAGFAALLRWGAGKRWKMAVASLVTAATPILVLATNYADHDRTGRHGAEDYAVNLLESLEPNAILFLDGDNYTFPTWYAQEVLGVRRDVTIVNLAYLGTPWYAPQLISISEGGNPLPSTARPADLLYGRYSIVYLPDNSQLSTFNSQLSTFNAPDALSELRRLYADTAPTPRLAASTLRLAGPDSVTINLRAASRNGRYITLRELFIADVLATNAAAQRPRPVYWQNQLGNSTMQGLYPAHIGRSLFARKYLPGADTAYLADEAMAFIPAMRWGGTDTPGVYIDPYVGDQVSRQRQALNRLGRALIRDGRHEEALEVALLSYTRIPREAWPYQGMPDGDGGIEQQGLALADIIISAARSSGDARALALGRDLKKKEEARLADWHRWHRSLPAWRRSLISTESKRLLIEGTRDKGQGTKKD